MKAYISCPLDEPWSKVEDLKEWLESSGYEASYHIRGERYSDRKLREADIFILILPNNKVNVNEEMMTRGCHGELITALCLKKPLYLYHFAVQAIDENALRNHHIVRRTYPYVNLKCIKKPVVINAYDIY